MPLGIDVALSPAVTMPILIEAAQDSNLLPFVYDACDQWCRYCPVTSRCLAFKCRAPESSSQDIYNNLAERMFEGMIFLKQLLNAEGRDSPEIDAILSDDPRERAMVQVDDPLERMGLYYMQVSSAYLVSRADFPFEMRPRPEGPTPYEVFAWYHALVPAKIYRAMVSSAAAARGETARIDDARRSAKVALIGLDRSIVAIDALIAEDDDARLEFMRKQACRLRRQVEARFPDARAFIRPGLDAVCGQDDQSNRGAL